MINKILETYRNHHIVVVGNGGTGSNLVPHLCQWAYSVQEKEKISITLADEDIVEPSNIGRQFFIEPEVGKNKAKMLQRRYHRAWNVNVSYYPYYIREAESLIKLLKPPACHNGQATLAILVSCVDNHFSRRIFHKVFYKLDDMIYLDAGNAEFHGQVVMGMRFQGKTLLKPLGEIDPNVYEEQDEIEVGGTCNREVIKQPQNLLANLWAATVLLTFLNNIVALKDVPIWRTMFSGHTTRSKPIYA